ncbi:MAG: hypothetical protein ACK4R0_06030 [Blastomonas sp.]
MNARKKGKPDMDMSNLGFDEALARLIQTDPKEIANLHERVAKDAKEIESDAKEHFDDIKSGGRRFKRPFRP